MISSVNTLLLIQIFLSQWGDCIGTESWLKLLYGKWNLLSHLTWKRYRWFSAHLDLGAMHLSEHHVLFLLFSSWFFFFPAVLGLRCHTWGFPSCSEWGQLFIAVCGLLTVVASLVGEKGFTCSMAQGIFPDQGLNPCPCIGRQILKSLDYQGSPLMDLYLVRFSTCRQRSRLPSCELQ